MTANPWKEEEAVVEVAMKLGAQVVPVKTAEPVTDKGVPGVEVPIPTLPTLETTKKVEVAPMLVILK